MVCSGGIPEIGQSLRPHHDLIGDMGVSLGLLGSVVAVACGGMPSSEFVPRCCWWSWCLDASFLNLPPFGINMCKWNILTVLKTR